MPRSSAVAEVPYAQEYEEIWDQRLGRAVRRVVGDVCRRCCGG